MAVNDRLFAYSKLRCNQPSNAGLRSTLPHSYYAAYATTAAVTSAPTIILQMKARGADPGGVAMMPRTASAKTDRNRTMLNIIFSVPFCVGCPDRKAALPSHTCKVRLAAPFLFCQVRRVGENEAGLGQNTLDRIQGLQLVVFPAHPSPALDTSSPPMTPWLLVLSLAHVRFR
jgi:hypothetical protein